MRISAIALLAVGSVLVAFAVGNAVWLYYGGIPRATLNVTLPILGQTVTAKISGMPDPYATALTAVRALLLLAIGLIGAKLISIGLAEWREEKREKVAQAYTEQYYGYTQY